MLACELGGGNRPTPPPCGSADDQRWSRGCPASENWSTILSQGPRRTTRGTLVRPICGSGRASELHRWPASWITALACSCRPTDRPIASARSGTRAVGRGRARPRSIRRDAATPVAGQGCSVASLDPDGEAARTLADDLGSERGVTAEGQTLAVTDSSAVDDVAAQITASDLPPVGL